MIAPKLHITDQYARLNTIKLICTHTGTYDARNLDHDHPGNP